MSPFSAPFSGAHKSEGCCFQSERLLYGREPNGVLRAEPGKQRQRSCRTPELARSSGPRNERHKKRTIELSRYRVRGRSAEEEWWITYGMSAIHELAELAHTTAFVDTDVQCHLLDQKTKDSQYAVTCSSIAGASRRS
jgi:hypothetical protein